jgi:hypothetical protein
MDVSPVIFAALASRDLCRRLVDETSQPLLTSAVLVQLASNLQWLERSGGEVISLREEWAERLYSCLVRGEVEGAIAYAGSFCPNAFLMSFIPHGYRDLVTADEGRPVPHCRPTSLKHMPGHS